MKNRLLLAIGMLMASNVTGAAQTGAWGAGLPASSSANFTTVTMSVANVTGAGTNYQAFGSPGTMLGPAGSYIPDVIGDTSLTILFEWNDAGTGTAEVTFTFSNPVTDPILHVDRLGGNETPGAGTEPYQSNSTQWTIDFPKSPGVTGLTRISGPDDEFWVRDSTDLTNPTPATADTFLRQTEVDLGIDGGGTECFEADGDGTRCGSVQVNGTFTSVTFDLTKAVGPEPPITGGGDGVEFIWTFNLDSSDAPSSYGTATNGFSDNTPYFGPTILDNTSILTNDTDPDDDGTNNADPFSDVTGDGTGIGDTFEYEPDCVNPGTTDAFAAAWVDWNQNGQFEAGEVSNATCPPGGGTTPFSWVIPATFDYTQPTWLRQRISVDAVGVASPTGGFSAGEVEDYEIPAGELPVDLASFLVTDTGKDLVFEWSTASETFHLGYSLWAEVNGEWKNLKAQVIRSDKSTSFSPSSYRMVIKKPRGTIGDVGLSSIDLRGQDDFYGPFTIGQEYGDSSLPEPIDWTEIRDQHATSMQERGFVLHKNSWIRESGAFADRLAQLTESYAANYPAVIDIAVEEDGLVEISYDDLLEEGIDLAGVRVKDIAITLKGEPVGRYVRAGIRQESGGRNRFGPRGFIHFYAEAPKGEDALYTAVNRYRIELNPSLIVETPTVTPVKDEGANATGVYTESLLIEEQNEYDFMSPGDAWVMSRLRSVGAAVAQNYNIQLADDMIAGTGSLRLELGALTDHPAVDNDGFEGADPDHRVEVSLNGTTLTTADHEGYGAWTLDLNTDGLLSGGANDLQLRLPMDTGYPSEVVLVDRIVVNYDRQLATSEEFHEFTGNGESDYRVSFNIPMETEDRRGNMFAYAWSDGNLVRLSLNTSFRNVIRNDDGFDVLLPNAGEARYVVGRRTAFNKPASISIASDKVDLLSEEADYLLIAHPAFIPTEGDLSHPLSVYMQAKTDEGYTPRLVNLYDIYNNYSNGMPLPSAITQFLNDAAPLGYSHVLLVGGDTYDYLDREGQGALSFIPTPYTPTSEYIQHTPSDTLLVDFDGNKVPEKAIGRWPVRTLAELTTIVDKTLAWMSSDMPSDASAVLVAESQEDGDFSSQLNDLAAGSLQNWTVSTAYADELGSESAARTAMIDAVNAGRTLTVFDGHGSLTSWGSWNSTLFSYSMMPLLNNAENPTLVMPLACYTTYVNSVDTNTLGHQLLLGSDSGAVAIHGSATLSSLNDNGKMASLVLEQQQSGKTLGLSILEAKQTNISQDLVRGWNLIGDPTVTIEPPFVEEPVLESFPEPPAPDGIKY